MKCSVFIACSLDGFIAGKDGSLEWLASVNSPEGGDFGYGDFMKTVDAIVMGRKTFETVLGFGEWPYGVPVFVLSDTLASLPENLKGKAGLLRGPVSSIPATLAARGFASLYVDGGSTIRAFLREGLIDEMTVSTVPVLLGDGIPLFGETGAHAWFEVESSARLSPLLCQTRYRRRTDGA